MFGQLKNWLSVVLKRSPPRPPKIVTIDVPHSLGKAESRRRLEVADKSFANQIPPWGGGTMIDWQDDRMYFFEHGISGYVQVAEDCVQIHAAIPDSSLYPAQAIANSIKRKMERRLNLSTETKK